MKKIQILGTGCPKCNQLAENADQALAPINAPVRPPKTATAPGNITVVRF